MFITLYYFPFNYRKRNNKYNTQNYSIIDNNLITDCQVDSKISISVYNRTRCIQRETIMLVVSLAVNVGNTIRC